MLTTPLFINLILKGVKGDLRGWAGACWNQIWISQMSRVKTWLSTYGSDECGSARGAAALLVKCWILGRLRARCCFETLNMCDGGSENRPLEAVSWFHQGLLTICGYQAADKPETWGSNDRDLLPPLLIQGQLATSSIKSMFFVHQWFTHAKRWDAVGRLYCWRWRDGRMLWFYS